MADRKRDTDAFVESLKDSGLYSIAAYFQDAHPALIDDVLAESESIERLGLVRYARKHDMTVEAAFQTLVTGLAIRYHRAVTG